MDAETKKNQQQHKNNSSLLAHQDNCMALRFVPGTHCFFTAGKDKAIKYWDADHFEHILTHTGHQAEARD